MKNTSHQHQAPKAPVAMGSLVVDAMAWNEAIEAPASLSAQEVIGGSVRTTGISGSVRTTGITLENHSTLNIHVPSIPPTRRL